MAANAALAAIYLLAAIASLRFSFFHPIVSTIWIPSGIALAAVLLYGPRLLWGVAAGVLMLNFWNSVPVVGALGIAAGCTLAAYCGYWMLTRINPRNANLASLRGMTSFMFYGAAVSPLVAAIAGPLALAAAGVLPGYDIPGAWLLWWMGDSLGILFVTPLLLAWMQDPNPDLRSPRTWQALALISVQSVAAFVVFHGLLEAPLSMERAIYALIPLAVWLAVGYPLRYIAAGNAALFAIAVLETSRGTGPFAEGSREINLLLLHLFLVVVSFTTLLVAGVNAERTRALRRANQSADRFQRLSELSAEWYWEQDESLRFTYMSASASAPAGTSPGEFIGKTRFELGFGWESEEARQRHAADLEARRAFRDLLVIRTMPGGDRIYARVSGRPVFDETDMFKGYQGTGRDVAAQVSAEQRLARLRDFYAALSRAQSAIIHASNQQALLQEICEVAVTHGRVRFARICLIDPATGWLENAAVAGNHNDYPYRTRVSVNPEIAEGQGPTGDALRSGAPYIDNDAQANSRNRQWLPFLEEAGVRSTAVYPLRRAGRVTGSLHLYASERNWFDDELFALIHELAANISFALDNFDREATRQTTEKALRHSEQRFRDIADAAGEFVWENDGEGRFTYLSARVVDVVGYTAEELLGRRPVEFMPPEEAARVKAWLADNTQPDRSFRGLEHIFLSKTGEEIWMQVSGVPTWDENGGFTGHRGTTRDVTAIKQSEARISYLATRDPLTELPNRLLFNDRLEQGIINARRNGGKVAVLFIDLDRFKNINDSLGHHIGDLLLKEVSRLMADCIRKGDTLSRLGGDEFVVTLEGLGHAEDAAQVARKILAALGKPMQVGGHRLNTTCSMGISIFPNDAEDGRELMKNADTAMYHAKELGRNNFQFFSPEMNVRAVERHQLETELRRALEDGEFVLHYQPQADLRTGRLVGMEALIRWQHPERGLVPPLSFIPVAEESGLIERIGQWALRSACEQNRSWQQEGLEPLKVAVNISARQFSDPRGFADVVAALLRTTELDPRYLELEITESMLLKNVAENVAVLQKLGDLGARIAVDDFGTGYSSLAYLKQLPIDTLKIDRTFVRDIEVDSDDAAIIQAIIAMAHGLDLRVTAEGVETEGQLAALRRLGCDEYQGYFLGKPLPAAEFRSTFLTGRSTGRRTKKFLKQNQ